MTEKEVKFSNKIKYAIQLANEDPVGKKIVGRMPNCKLIVKITDGMSMNIQVANGVFSLVESPDHPQAIYEYGDIDAALELLEKKRSVYVATVHKQLKLQGLSPLNDTFDKILNLVHEREMNQ